jgi:hypothetical protein
VQRGLGLRERSVGGRPCDSALRILARARLAQ